MARGFNHGLYGMQRPGSTPESSPEEFSGVFYSKSRKQQLPASTPPPPPGPGLPADIPPTQQLGGMLNGFLGNMFENNNWWLWAALLIIFFNPDLRKKLLGGGKEADQNP
ncbi:MAG: hypothetical protein VB106_14780 [Clostridiaceae bacterium]|jgi:hypothetical protein|nr:hypothetical protein [Clostridiaceae bacterium]